MYSFKQLIIERTRFCTLSVLLFLIVLYTVATINHNIIANIYEKDYHTYPVSLGDNCQVVISTELSEVNFPKNNVSLRDGITKLGNATLLSKTIQRQDGKSTQQQRRGL